MFLPSRRIRPPPFHRRHCSLKTNEHCHIILSGYWPFNGSLLFFGKFNEQSIPQIGRIQFGHLQCCSESSFESPTSTKVTGFPKDLKNFQRKSPTCGRVTFFRESTLFDTRVFVRQTVEFTNAWRRRSLPL